jgi:hypothetical protein
MVRGGNFRTSAPQHFGTSVLRLERLENFGTWVLRFCISEVPKY